MDDPLPLVGDQLLLLGLQQAVVAVQGA